MEKKQLAMVSVPLQTFKEAMEPEKALAAGTLFPELLLPFYAVPADMMEKAPGEENYPGKTEEKRKKMKKLTEISFALDDLNLYLCTHAEDEEAFLVFQEYAKERKALLRDLEEEEMPLHCETALSLVDRTKTPCPWKGACDHVVL